MGSFINVKLRPKTWIETKKYFFSFKLIIERTIPEHDRDSGKITIEKISESG